MFKHYPQLMATAIFLAFLLTGCERSAREPGPSAGKKGIESQTDPAKKVDIRAKRLLQEPVALHRLELPSDALPLWRAFQELKPTLVLLSDDPFLQPLPPIIREQALTLVKDGAPNDLARMASPHSPNPVLLPHMALSAALEAGFFSRVIWVLPSAEDPEKISLSTFKAQLVNFGAVTQEEAESFKQRDRTFVGVVRGVPFVAAFPFSLPPQSGPMLLHTDLSYFRPFYKNEISTPLFPIIFDTFSTLQKTNWQVLGASFSFSQINADVGLETRFLGSILSQLYKTPDLLASGELPGNWKKRFDILYLENLFRPEKILEISLEMEKDGPQDASGQFTLYQAYRENNRGKEALDHLARAVQLDSAYGMEYINLAPLALQKKRPDEAVRMLKLASDIYPENPFVRLRLAEAHLNLGQKKEAFAILEKINNLPWSTVYYPQMPEIIEQFRAKLADR